MRHLLVTNDFPPKIGGIQSYLYELWRRLPPEDVTVLTTRFKGAEGFDRRQAFRVVRSSSPVLLPTPELSRQIRQLAREVDAGLVVLDPALPLGLVAARLGLPYGVVVHGAEVSVPGRLPLVNGMLVSVLAPAALVIAAGGYPAEEARRVLGRRLPPTVIVPPGVDTERFHPLGPAERDRARARLGLPVDGRLVVSVSRLVPRKGMDVLIRAVGLLRPCMPDLCLAIGGRGRDRERLLQLIEREGLAGAVHMLGRVADEDLPQLDACADVWAMLCRDRWLGLEQEGFGIVFLEAAAAGVPQVAGRSGGAHEAVVHGETGLVVDDPSDPAAAAETLRSLLEDPEGRRRLGAAARKRVVADFDYNLLAKRLQAALEQAGA
ncbi:MAG TPA: glycosyltransferase family 4 protein [Acidimicrobiales bacterium]|nr:glycosyltransferase family 4 protein [Acidimicrobiales bacterium]